MAMTCIKREVNIVGTELITSKENWLCDAQSRWDGIEKCDRSMRIVGERNEAFKEMREIEVSRSEEMLELGDPKLEWWCQRGRAVLLALGSGPQGGINFRLVTRLSGR